MILSRVIYELLQTDDTVDAKDRRESVCLDGQLRLEFFDGRPVFIAWTKDVPPDDDFHVGRSHESFLPGGAEVEYDASYSTIWEALIGKELAMSYRGSGQQVLEARSQDAAVLCCTFERGMWGANTLYIGRQLPDGVSGPPDERDNHQIEYLTREQALAAAREQATRDLSESESLISYVAFFPGNEDFFRCEFRYEAPHGWLQSWRMLTLAERKPEEQITDDRIRAVARAGKLITAIRLYRCKYGVGVAEGKAEVEQLLRENI